MKHRLPELPAEAVAEYWQLVRAALVAGGLSKKDAATTAKAYRAWMKPAGWTIYNDDPEDSAEAAKDYAAWMREEQAKPSNGTVKKRAKQPAKVADELPTKEEILQLPRWAQVAFAARCARRVEPLFLNNWPDAPLKHVEAVSHAVAAVEQFAGQLNGIFDDRIMKAVYDAREAAGQPQADGIQVHMRATGVAHATYYACVVASHQHGERYAPTPAEGSWVFPDAPVWIRRDLATLLTEVQQGNWTDDTPVPPSVFGPLWPEGPPKDWPELPKPKQLKLTVQVPDGMDDAAVCEKLKTLTAALGRLNVAGGGHGLKLVPPVEFTEEQVRGLADVVREEGQKSKGGRHPRR